MDEKWVNVAENPAYAVSNSGLVKSLARCMIRTNGSPYRTKDRIMAQAKTPRGYRFVCLYEGGESVQRYVHHLVAAAFIGPRPEGYEINHKDGNKANNSYGNLEYVTRQVNMAHAKATGLIDFVGEKNPRSKYTADQMRRGYDLVAGGMAYKEAAATVGVAHAALEAACRGDNWRSLGLTPIYRTKV